MFHSICLFNSGVGNMFFSDGTGRVGGAEVQHMFLAEELVKRGFKVTMVTFIRSDYCNRKTPYCVNKKGISIWLIPVPFHGKVHIFQYLRIIINIWLIVRKIHPDIFMQRGGGNETALIGFLRFLYRKKFAFNIASMGDLISNPELKCSAINRSIIHFGIARADVVFAQSDEQKKIFNSRWNQKCCVIKNIYRLNQYPCVRSVPPIILWVGTVRPEWKRPELFLKLARAIPHGRFQMVGGPSRDISYYNRIQEESREISNLEFTGFVPYKEVGDCFSRASILVNTSIVEGFPNTFIEAWLCKIPVVSLHIDPDEVICRYNLGFHSGTFEQLVNDIETLLKDKDLRDEKGINGRKYVEREHDIRKNVDHYISCLSELYDK